MTWQPIATAPRDRTTLIDVILHYLASGKSCRVTNCRRVYSNREACFDTWESDGKIIHGRKYYGSDGDEYFEWGNVPGAQTVVTHWMPIPVLPSEEPQR